MLEWMIVVAAAAAVAVLAWRAGALAGMGAVAAAAVGAVVLGFAGIGAAAVLVLFFASSSALSALPGDGERRRRGARQVLANGSLAALAAALYHVHPAAGPAFLGALAAATADTWATEVGVRLGRSPRSILSLRPKPPGTSGAISLAGTLAAVAGAAAVGVAGAWWLGASAGHTIAAVTAAGAVGATLDSVLGDGVQAGYQCPACGARPQVARHEGCPVRASRVAGLPGLDNDFVNWITTGAGAATAVALSGLG